MTTMKKVVLFFGVFLFVQSFSCTTKYLTKDQLPQDKITFLDEKDQFEMTFDYNLPCILQPDERDNIDGSILNGKKGLVIGTTRSNDLYVIEIKDATFPDFRYVFTSKLSIDASKAAAKERDKKLTSIGI